MDMLSIAGTRWRRHMCGITGWISFDRDLRREEDTLKRMTQTMMCRGPDASGVWTSPHAALGHRRLAVIDLPGGVQPMSIKTPNGEVSLVYSGEVYNFIELRNELSRLGEQFYTSSDTEVVLRGYLRWGTGLAERINGMYAFAIWDGRVQKLVMIRDRLGIKPFYFYRTSDGVLFGSEPKAILANPIAKRVVDIDGLREVFGFVMTPRHAIWSGMMEMQPGTVLTLDADGISERTYWRLESQAHTDNLETTVGHIRELLDDIVCRQLVADVPRCVLLSGGLDSSALTALSAAQLAEQGEKLRTFSVDFVGYTENFKPDDVRGTPDTPYAHDVVAHVGTEHTDIVLDHKMLADPSVRRATVSARDVPMGLGEMDFSLYLLFSEIRKRSTVALSGESADEIFGGYKQFHDPATRKAREFPWLAINRGPGLDRKGTGLHSHLLAELDLDRYRAEKYASALVEIERVESESDFEFSMRTMSYLHLTRFMRHLLDRKDRISMAVGLEVRVPYCDHRLVEYVYNAPWSMKNYDGREKSLLRGAVREILPKSIIERVKSPYPSTQAQRYVEAIQQQAKDLLAQRDHDVFVLVDPDWLNKVTAQDPATVVGLTRLGIERALDLSMWLDIYRPELNMP
jgi:asparagine synthase (glutamine-hydrolysing)